MRRLCWLLVLCIVCLHGPCRADNYALLIGIDTYEDHDGINPLHGAADDARGVAQALQEVAGFTPRNVHLLTSASDSKPTRRNIIFELSQLQEKVKPGDMVFLLYAGHGIDKDGQPCLLPYDTDTRTRDTYQDTVLPTALLRDKLSRLPAKTLILAFDMCRTDPFVAGAREGHAANNNLGEVMRASLVVSAAHNSQQPTAPTATITLYACSPHQHSYEWLQKGRGFFSYFLERGLRQEAADAQGVVRVSGLVKYVQKAVEGAVAREIGAEQTPFYSLDGSEALETVLATGRPAGRGGETAVPVAVDPSKQAQFEALFQRGIEMMATKQYKLAQSRFEQALALEPNSARAVNQLGRCYYFQKHDTEAEKLYRKAMELDPTNAWPVNGLAVLYHLKKDYVQAERFYRKAIALQPEKGLYHANLALCLLTQDRRDEALTEAKKALQLGYKDHSVYAKLGLKP